MARRKLRRRSVGDWGNTNIAPGESREVELTLGESYSGVPIKVPVLVRRALEDGPTVFVTGALHGDELNGTGVVRALIRDPEFHLLRGAVILVPVLNLLAFERHSRYLPDRRDLNRSFPGVSGGSLAGRIAKTIFKELVGRSDFGIDIHTAAVRRTNYPNVRADLSDPRVAPIAEAFGAEIVVGGRGPKGSFRREASLAGCPTIVVEGGEVWKVEPSIVESSVRGVKNVLRSLDMLGGERETPKVQITVAKAKWIRADFGGFLRFHVQPGDIVEKGQPLATNTTFIGDELNVLEAPFDAVVIGMVTLPAITPGDPVFNLAKLPPGTTPDQLRRSRSATDALEEQMVDDLSTNVTVVEPD